MQAWHLYTNKINNNWLQIGKRLLHTKDKLNNFHAAKLLQSLYPDKNAVKLSKSQRKKIVDEATLIYTQIDDKKSIDVIHKLLKIYLHLGFSHKMEHLWTDIHSVNKSKLEYSLIIKCCLDSNNILKCLEALRWMESCKQYSNYTLQIHDKLIQKLISKCAHNLKHITFIHRLIDNKCIANNNTLIKTALIRSYDALNEVDFAWNIFQSIPDCENDIICVTSMMKVFINHKQFDQALDLYHNTSLHKDNIAHQLALSACAKSSYIDQKKGEIIIQSMDRNHIKSKTAMIQFYAKCGDIDNAKQIFDDNNTKDSVMNGAMMQAFVDNNYNSQALKLYETQIQKNDIMHLFALKACMNLKYYEKGKLIHKTCATSNNIKVRNALISFYSTFNDLQNASDIFDAMKHCEQDRITCNVMMQLYLEDGNNHKVLQIYNKIEKEDNVNVQCHVLALKAYYNLNDMENTHKICNLLHENENHLESKLALIEFHGNNGNMEDALRVYHSIKDENRNANSTRAILSIYIRNHCYTNALLFYESISDDIKNNICHSLAIKACINLKDYEKGKEIHDSLNNLTDIQLKTVLIDFYGCCNNIKHAMHIFNEISEDEKDIICVGAMMKCFVNNDANRKAIEIYNNLNEIDRNLAIYCLVIKAYANIHNYNEAQQVINKVNAANEQNIENIEWISALIYLYGKSNDIDKIWKVYDCVDDNRKDIVLINHMLHALQINGYNDDCLQLFQGLISDLTHLKPNIVTFVHALTVCSNSTHFQFGVEIHNMLQTKQNEWILSDISIKICLMNMYGKCGKLEICKEIFYSVYGQQMENVNVCNAMMKIYGDNGAIKDANALYHELKLKNNTDKNTYAIMISIYAHFGLLEDAIRVWENDINTNEIKFDEYIISSLVHAFSSKGLMDKAQDILQEASHFKIVN